MQGNPISLTDPFGLCPEGGGILDYLKLAGHTLLDLAGFIPVVGFIPDLVNSYWYHCEKNPTMAMASFISAILGIGDFAEAALKGVGWVAKCSKLVKAADVVKDTCRFTGAVAQTGLNIQNTKIAWDSVVSEYQSTGKVSFLNAGNLALSAFGVGVGAKSISSAAKKVSKYASKGTQKVTSLNKSGTGVLGEGTFERYMPNGSRVTDVTNLPGSEGIKISKRLSTDEMTFLTQEYGVEFAQVYKYGKGPNGGGRQYYLYSGTVNKVRVPIANDIMLINHTYPS